MYVVDLIYKALLFVKYSLQSIILLSEMESAFVPSNEHASTTRSNTNSSSVSAKCDPAWDNVTEELKDGKSSCLFETFLLFECNELIYLVLYLKLICYLDVMNIDGMAK